MDKFTATCAVTGKSEKLTMHAFRNENGDMIGWVFLSEHISTKIKEFNIEVKTEWKTETKAKPIGFGRIKIDNL